MKSDNARDRRFLRRLPTEAAQGQRLWSIVIHFQYQDGFEFDYVLERGVSTADLTATLADCGRSHRVGSVVHYHCYPVPE